MTDGANEEEVRPRRRRIEPGLHPGPVPRQNPLTAGVAPAHGECYVAMAEGVAPPDSQLAVARIHASVLLVVEMADAEHRLAQDQAGFTRRWQRFVHRARQVVASEHHGRLASVIDHGLVLSFQHVRPALRAAAALHRLAELANADHAGQPPLQLRVAIHAGQAASPHATGLAAADLQRLASLNARAQAGETVLSAAAREQLADGLDATLEDLGEDLAEWADDSAGTETRTAACAAGTTDGMSAGTTTATTIEARRPRGASDGLARAYRVAASAHAPVPLALPIRSAELLAAVAVVPFEAREHWGETLAIGDLIADGVIARLSHARHLRVINRLSTQALRGRNSTVVELQQHLGASHVLSGEYVESSGRLDIRYQLRDLAQGEVIRSGRLSASLAELLQLESETLATLAQQVHDALFDEASQAVLSQPLPTLRSFALLMGGIRLLHRSARRDFAASFEVLDHLVREHPHCAEPLIWQAKWYALRAVQGFTTDRVAEAQAAMDCLARALDNDPHNSFALAMQGFVHCVLTRDTGAAATSLRQAIALNPNESLGHLFYGMTQGLQGRFTEGIASFGSATAISPLDPACYIYDSLGAYLHLGAGHQAHTIALARRSLRLNREHAHSWRALTIAQAELGQLDEARASLHELLRLDPGLTLRSYLAGAQADERNRARFADALARAGLPR